MVAGLSGRAAPPAIGAPEVALGQVGERRCLVRLLVWLSTAMTVYMSMRVEKMSAWMKFRSPSSSIMIDGHAAIVSAVMTPRATSPPKMLPKRRIESVMGLMNSSMNSMRPTNRPMSPAPMPSLNPLKTKNLPR